MNPPDILTASNARILVALSGQERTQFFTQADAARLSGPNVHWASPEELQRDAWEKTLKLRKPEVLISAWATAPLPAAWAMGASCPLRYVCHVTGSVRQLVPRGFLERGGTVTNWGGLVSPQVAEHALLLALAALRNLTSWPAFIARDPSKRHYREMDTSSLFGRTVGLHGYGGVARSLIPMLRPFGTRIIAYSAGVPASLMLSDGVEPMATLEELFTQSQVLIECESLTPTTKGSVTRDVLGRLQHGAVFVNVGRGAVVDEAALIEEALSGRLRVAVDVSAQEPLTPDSPLCKAPVILASPHIAGPTGDRYSECGARALRNLSQYLKGEPAPDRIDLAMYDRAT